MKMNKSSMDMNKSTMDDPMDIYLSIKMKKRYSYSNLVKGVDVKLDSIEKTNFVLAKGKNPSKEYYCNFECKKNELFQNGCGIINHFLDDCILTNIGYFIDGVKTNECISIKYPLSSIYVPIEKQRKIEIKAESKNYHFCETYQNITNKNIKDTQVFISKLKNDKVEKDSLVMIIWVEDDEESLKYIKSVIEKNKISMSNMYSLPKLEKSEKINLNIRIFYGYINEETNQQTGLLISSNSSNVTIYKGSMNNFKAESLLDEESFYFDKEENIMYLGTFKNHIFKKGSLLVNIFDLDTIKLYKYEKEADNGKDFLKQEKCSIENYSYYLDIIGFCDQEDMFTVEEKIVNETTHKEEIEYIDHNFISYAYIIFIKALSFDFNSLESKIISNKEYNVFINELYESIGKIENLLHKTESISTEK